MGKNIIKLTIDDLRELVKETINDQPRIDITSKYRRDDPRYKNKRQRQAEAFPGKDDMDRLANGIMETIIEMGGIDEGKERKHCLTSQELFQLRGQIYKQVLAFISQYEDAKKLSPHLKGRSK